MPSPIVTVHSSSSRGTLDLELPGEVPLRRLLPELARVLQLPATDDDGRSITYQLVHQARLRLLDESETLLNAGVVTGHELYLVSATAPARVTSEEEGPVPLDPPTMQGPGRNAAALDDYARGRPFVRLHTPTSPPHPAMQPTKGTHTGTPVRPTHAGPDPLGRRTIALWSGPAGGTGRTTLALALAALAAEKGIDTVLLAPSGSAVSAYLHLPRVPNTTAFFESGDLSTAEQVISWERESSHVSLQVILGPALPQVSAVRQERIGGLVEAAEGIHRLVILDLPPLTPGGSYWVSEPLARATDVVLVAPPTVAGVGAVVEALGTLRDLETRSRTHLVLVRRAPSGLSKRDFAEGVTSLWGSCPEIVAEAPFLPDLSRLLDRGELAEEERLSLAVASLAEVTVGLARS